MCLSWICLLLLYTPMCDVPRGYLAFVCVYARECSREEVSMYALGYGHLYPLPIHHVSAPSLLLVFPLLPSEIVRERAGNCALY